MEICRGCMDSGRVRKDRGFLPEGRDFVRPRRVKAGIGFAAEAEQISKHFLEDLERWVGLDLESVSP